MEFSSSAQTFTEELLEGEIIDTKIEHKAFIGPIKETLIFPKDSITMLIFIKGSGFLKTDSMSYHTVPESIAIPMNKNSSFQLELSNSEELHYLMFTKKLSSQDIENFPEENKYDLFFTRFEDCEPYTEKIKSPNTVSRTVLPADIIPRVSLGTVEAVGPDEVGAHKHPMLDQLFLGLTNNDIIVHADDASTEFKEYSLLHIPIGSSHWVTVAENKKMYYMWMDFFLTKEGQEWLKTHKPMSIDENEP
ncbi:hypothetical protein [Chondrinema litorale]|uniref:hypothetical protein n=1 Tax=Chondrinema litorale TaxID=2994555 RepID=UPI0025435832|nr:hypothetical protein [Chondrinema litorale]UZR98941.1 hypothetical protein OQ292_34390 [Chondrinema litorale]